MMVDDYEGPYVHDDPSWGPESMRRFGIDPGFWLVCPSCEEIVPRSEANEHVCPIEELE